MLACLSLFLADDCQKVLVAIFPLCSCPDFKLLARHLYFELVWKVSETFFLHKLFVYANKIVHYKALWRLMKNQITALLHEFIHLNASIWMLRQTENWEVSLTFILFSLLCIIGQAKLRDHFRQLCLPLRKLPCLSLSILWYERHHLIDLFETNYKNMFSNFENAFSSLRYLLPNLLKNHVFIFSALWLLQGRPERFLLYSPLNF